MRRRLMFLVLLAGLLTLVAIPAGAHVRSHGVRADADEPNLDAAFYTIEEAEALEYDAENALSTLGPLLAGFAGGQLFDAHAKLVEAPSAVAVAQAAGEISSGEADEIDAAVADARKADEDA